MLYSGKMLELREVTQMDNKALFNLPYGVFLLATSADGVENGCITNTCIQVANDPTRIAIAVINANFHDHFHNIQRIDSQALKSAVGSDVSNVDLQLIGSQFCQFFKHR